MKFKIPSMSLRTQLVTSFLVIIISILVMGYGYFYKDSVNTNEEHSKKTTYNQFKQIEYQIESLARETKKISDLILVNDNVQSYLNDKNLTEIDEINLSKNIIDYFDRMVSTYDYLQSIFICFEKGKVLGVIGESNTYNHLLSDKNSLAFFNSELYKESKSQFKDLTWGVGDNSLFFGIQIPTQTSSIITAARALRGLEDVTKSSTLVINIKEKDINNTYRFLSDSNQTSIYIVDKNDKIVSHSNTALIGTTERLISIKTLKGQSGNFVVERNNFKEKVFFYKIVSMDWTIISEMPLSEFDRNANVHRVKFFILLAVSVLTAFLLVNIWMNRITKPLRMLTKAMSGIENGKLGHVIEEEPKNEITGLIISFNRMSNGLVELIEKNRVIEEKKREYEVEALRSQINPHFIYNTLNIIKWMAVVQKCKSISEAITALASIIGPLFKDKDPLCSIEQEMQYLKNYIRIINIRFGEGMSIIFELPEEIRQYKILRFSLQPIIENAVLHGYENTFDNSRISITSIEEKEALLINIEDNGKGMLKEQMDKLNLMFKSDDDSLNNESGIGIVNVNQRIKLHFGNEFGISIFSEQNKGTKVSLRLPKLK